MLRQGPWVLVTAFAAAQLSCAHDPAPLPRGEPIAAGLEVTMAYTVTQADGTLISTTEGRAPFSYIHGQGEILPALEQALTGLRAGEQRRIAVTAEQAFGLFNEAKVVTLPRQQLPPDMTMGKSGPGSDRPDDDHPGH
ncbi:MAG: FKBP-type peptidyl-prolyl cis-trans isomerase [bacterium]